MRTAVTAAILLALAGSPVHAEELPWRTDVDAALAEAAEKGKPALIGFYVSFGEPDLEAQDAALVAENVKTRLAEFVLVKADVMSHSRWRRGTVWAVPRYVFIGANGLSVLDVTDRMSPELLDRFASAQSELQALVQKATDPESDRFAAHLALARWHAERLNRAEAIVSFRTAATHTEDVDALLPILLEMTQSCSGRGIAFRDDDSAAWAIARVAELDPEDERGFLSKAELRAIEVEIEGDRIEPGVAQADAFLAAKPKHPLAGEVLTRKVFGLRYVAEYQRAYDALSQWEQYTIDEKDQRRRDRSLVLLANLAVLKEQADRVPPSFGAIAPMIQDIYHNSSPEVLLHYLRRMERAADAPADQIAAFRVQLASRVIVGTDDGRLEEARGLLTKALADTEHLDERTRTYGERILEMIEATDDD